MKFEYCHMRTDNRNDCGIAYDDETGTVGLIEMGKVALEININHFYALVSALRKIEAASKQLKN